MGLGASPHSPNPTGSLIKDLRRVEETFENPDLPVGQYKALLFPVGEINISQQHENIII